MVLTNWLLSRKTRRPHTATRPARTRLGLQQLEARENPSANFLSAMALVNNAGIVNASDSAVDAAGNSYVTGSFSGTIDFDPSVARADGSDILTGHGTYDVYVAKYAPDNSLFWVRRMGSEYAYVSGSGQQFLGESSRGIAVDAAGNAYVSGSVAGVADFGQFSLANAGKTDAFLTKLDTNGNFLWVKGWGDANEDFGHDVTVDTAGNVLQVGYSTITAAGGGWIASGMEIRKYSPAAATLWTKHISDFGGEAYGVATDAAGSVYVSGNFGGTVDFDPDPRKSFSITGSPTVSSGSGVNAYVLKLTSAGAFSWLDPFVAKTGETAGRRINLIDLAVDPSGNVFAGGSYWGQIDVNPSSKIDQRLPYTYPTTGAIRANGVVVKLTPTGSLAWADPMQGGGVQSIAVDSAGAVYATGTFYESYSPGPGSPITVGTSSSTAYVTKLTSAGTIAWSVTFGSGGGWGIAEGTGGTVYVFGQCGNQSDLDPDPTNEYLVSTTRPTNFLLKLSQTA